MKARARARHWETEAATGTLAEHTDCVCAFALTFCSCPLLCFPLAQKRKQLLRLIDFHGQLADSSYQLPATSYEELRKILHILEVFLHWHSINSVGHVITQTHMWRCSHAPSSCHHPLPHSNQLLCGYSAYATIPTLSLYSCRLLRRHCRRVMRA